MKSPEQPGIPDEPADMENKTTTPEEWDKITRERRLNFGLGETVELTPERIKEIEESIKELIIELNQYDFTKYNSEIEYESIMVESEAISGKDRELAEAVIKEFLKFLKESK